MTEDEINKQVSKETGSMSSVSVGIDLDNQALRGLQETVQAINKEAKEMAINFKEALEALKEMGKDYGLTQVRSSTEISPSGTSGVPQRGAAGTTIVGGRAHEAKPVTPAVDSVSAALSGFKAFQTGAGNAPQYVAGGNIKTGGTGALGLVQKAFESGGGFTNAGNFASMAGTLAKVGVQAIDKRVEDARQYVLAADKSTLQMQQITGMSQRGVMDNLRMPLTDYKLGTNGINQLMSLQARTGINASQQASSVEFMRTLSGFSMGAEGASSIIESLASPETVNQMYMMTGMSLIGPGGKQKSTQSLIQGLAKRAGLDNKKIAESAIAPGSVTRATLSAMGVSGDLQDQVIQYGQANVNFREKGGKGAYDPTKEADRKRMGIDDTYAMEAEETARKRGKRDENFYQSQAGAYAKLERQTQRLTDVMGKLEEAIAPIISARTGSRIMQKIVGGFSSMLSAIPGVGPILGSIGSVIGDPRPRDNSCDNNNFFCNVPGGSGGGTTTTIPGGKDDTPPPPPPRDLTMWEKYNNWLSSGGSEEKAWSGVNGTKWPIQLEGENFVAFSGNDATNQDFTGLDFSFRRMLTQMSVMAHKEGAGVLTLRDGKRTKQEQETLFKSRFTEVTDPNMTHYTDAADGQKYPVIAYNGKNWMKRPNNTEPYAAPPGESLHEIGMAADLDLSDPTMKAWVLKNATRFGLVFPDKQDEPWHVQPAYARNSQTRTQLNELTGVPVNKDGSHDSFGFKWNSNMHSSALIEPNKWSSEFLFGIGAPATVNNMQFVKAWMAAEGSGGRYNPFNIVTGSTQIVNGVLQRERFLSEKNGQSNPVANYASEEEGLRYSIENLTTSIKPGKKNLLIALRKGSVSLTELARIRNLAGGGSQPGPMAPGTYTEATAITAAKETGPSSAQAYVDTNFSAGAWKDFGRWAGAVGDPMPSSSTQISSTQPSSMQPMSVPSSPMLSSSGSSGGGGTYHEGSTVTISPVINMTSTGNGGTVSEFDLRSMAKKIAKLIEQESNITKFRSM